MLLKLPTTSFDHPNSSKPFPLPLPSSRPLHEVILVTSTMLHAPSRCNRLPRVKFLKLSPSVRVSDKSRCKATFECITKAPENLATTTRSSLQDRYGRKRQQNCAYWSILHIGTAKRLFASSDAAPQCKVSKSQSRSYLGSCGSCCSL